MIAPEPILNIAKYLIESNARTGGLPSPIIVKGAPGTGKSWILNQVKEALLRSCSESGIYPISVPMHLNGQGFVESISRQIEYSRMRVLRKSDVKVRPPEKFVLFIENIDQLFNLSRSERANFSMPKRAHGAGAAQFSQIQHASEFRSFLIENSGSVSVIASASNDTSFMEDSELPFFQFFNLLELRPLNDLEAKSLLTQRIGANSFALSLLDVLDHLGGPSWPAQLTDGKIALLNLFSDTLVVDLPKEVEIFRAPVEEILSRVFALYFLKLAPHISLIIENLSYAEKLVIDVTALMADNFQSRDIAGVPNVYNLVNSLKAKGVLISSSEHNSALFSFASAAFKAYLRFEKKVPIYSVIKPSARAVFPW